jgi:hypothetical protein
MRKFSGKSGMVAVAAATAVLAVVGTVGAQAAGMIDGSTIKDGSITSVKIKDGTLRLPDLNEAAIARLRGDRGATGARGPQGPKGPQGASGLTGAYYSVAFYDVGDTNAGAIASVACKAQTDVAISGGVQTLGIGDSAAALARNTPVSNSFPGRMDYSTNTPKPDRLDGWIVQFGGTNDRPPLKTKIWALCVPGATIPVETTYTESN